MTTSLFDISADLDTPVSAYLKLKPFRPRFLLESVEGGERLARYSFIGFGDCLEVRLDPTGLQVGGAVRPVPSSRDELLDALREALRAAPRPLPEVPGIPLAGGLVGVSAYDLVRFFERLPGRARSDLAVPDACYLAPRSFLVFDHVTRGMALLHAGPESDRRLLRAEIIRALRGPVPTHRRRIRVAPPVPSLTRDEFLTGVARTKEYIAAGDVYQLVLSVRFRGRCDLDPFETYRALRLLNPSPYMYYCDLGDRVVVGSSPEALVKLNGARATMRPIAGTRPRGGDAAEDAALEVAPAAERVEVLLRERIEEDGVDREIAPPAGLFDGHPGVAGDLEAAVPAADLRLAAGQRDIDARHLVDRERLADGIDAPGGLEQAAQSARLDAVHLEVDVGGVDPEEPVAHPSAGDQRAAARGAHRLRDRQRRAGQRLDRAAH